MTGFRNRDVKERFDEKWEAVTESGCWIWIGSSAGDRYGSFHFPDYPSKTSNTRRMVSAHRAALFIYKGIVPETGLEVLHSCDVGFCCNPEHLSLGTHQDNMTDMVNKGRSPQNQRKLTDMEVDKARFLRSQGCEVKGIALLFNISPSHMSRVTQGAARKFARKILENEIDNII